MVARRRKEVTERKRVRVSGKGSPGAQKVKDMG